MSSFFLEEEGKPTLFVAGLSSSGAERYEEEARLKHPTEHLVRVPDGMSAVAAVALMTECDVLRALPEQLNEAQTEAA